ncbi:MAG: hypothetical protein Q9176_001405 [Flavoplaca citrina]
MVPSRPVPGCLPAELRLQILECCADVPTAVSLACTSKAFYSTWENFYQPVCERILKRSIECYDDALCLARAQEDPGQPTNFKECASRILSNAKIVEEACYALPTAVGEESSSEMEDWPSPTELTRFFHAYYVIWTKHIMRLPDRSSLEKAPEKMCETGSLREHYTVTIFWYWLRDCQEDSWIKPLNEAFRTVLRPYNIRQLRDSGMPDWDPSKLELDSPFGFLESDDLPRGSRRFRLSDLRRFRRCLDWRILKDDQQYLFDGIDTW